MKRSVCKWFHKERLGIFAVLALVFLLQPIPTRTSTRAQDPSGVAASQQTTGWTEVERLI